MGKYFAIAISLIISCYSCGQIEYASQLRKINPNSTEVIKEWIYTERSYGQTASEECRKMMDKLNEKAGFREYSCWFVQRRKHNE